MQVRVCTHWPLTIGGPKIDHLDMEAEPSELVADFKARYRLATECDQIITLCIQGTSRADDQQLWEEDFVVDEETGRVFIHLRVEDPELEGQVAAILAQGSRIIPLDQVTVKA